MAWECVKVKIFMIQVLWLQLQSSYWIEWKRKIHIYAETGWQALYGNYVYR